MPRADELISGEKFSYVPPKPPVSKPITTRAEATREAAETGYKGAGFTEADVKEYYGVPEEAHIVSIAHKDYGTEREWPRPDSSMVITYTVPTQEQLLERHKTKVTSVGPTPSREGDIKLVYGITPEEQEAMETLAIEEAKTGYIIFAGIAGIGIAPIVALKGAVLGLGLSQALKTGVGVFAGKSITETALTPVEATESAFGSAAFAVATSYVLQGINRVLPASVKQWAQSTSYTVKETVKQSRLGVALAKVSSELKYSEPYYTLRSVPSKISTWLVKRGPEGEIVRALSWEPVERTALIGFERSAVKGVTGQFIIGGQNFLLQAPIITEAVKTGGTYVTHPGFELWATISEAKPYVGYPVLRPMAAATYQALRERTRQELFGEYIKVFPAKEQLSTWETYSGTVEAHPYAGYPSTYRELVGVKIAEGPLTPFEQIAKEIESGRYPAMGGLGATQIPVFAKGEYEVTRQLGFPRYEERTARAIVQPHPLLQPPTARGALVIPLPLPSITRLTKTGTWEQEKQKYANLLIPRMAEEQRTVAIPLLGAAQASKLASLQIPTPMMAAPPLYEKTPTISAPSPPYLPETPKGGFPLFAPRIPGGGGDEVRRYLKGRGKWFKRTHKIPTVDQATRGFLGKKGKKVTTGGLSLGIGAYKPPKISLKSYKASPTKKRKR